MRKLLYLIAIMIIVASCGESENPNNDSNSEFNHFRIEFEYSGDIDRFIVGLSATAEGGEGWKFSDGSTLDSQFPNSFWLRNDFFDFKAKNPLSIETREKIRSFTMQYLVGLNPINPSPATLTGSFKIYKNGELLDSHDHVTTHELSMIFNFTKEYK